MVLQTFFAFFSLVHLILHRWHTILLIFLLVHFLVHFFFLPLPVHFFLHTFFALATRLQVVFLKNLRVRRRIRHRR